MVVRPYLSPSGGATVIMMGITWSIVLLKCWSASYLIEGHTTHSPLWGVFRNSLSLFLSFLSVLFSSKVFSGSNYFSEHVPSQMCMSVGVRNKRKNREVKLNSIHGLSSPGFQIVWGESKTLSAQRVKLYCLFRDTLMCFGFLFRSFPNLRAVLCYSGAKQPETLIPSASDL